MSEQTYPPKPEDIKKVILITHGGGRVSTYETLLEALTAVYQLDPDVRDAVEATMRLFETPTIGGES